MTSNTLINVVSLLVGLYFSLGCYIEALVLEILIISYRYFPFITKLLFGNLIKNAVIKSEYSDLRRFSCIGKFLLKLFVLRYGLTENMLVRLSRYIRCHELFFLIDNDKVFKFSEVIPGIYETTLDGEKFEYIAGDIII